MVVQTQHYKPVAHEQLELDVEQSIVDKDLSELEYLNWRKQYAIVVAVVANVCNKLNR